MSNIVPVTQGQAVGFVMPSAFSDKFKSNIGVGSATPTLSIRGKVWTVIKDDAESVYMDEEGNALPILQVIVLGQSMSPDGRTARTRSYFEAAYDGTNQSPVCVSYDGVRPADDSTDPQAYNCQACPKSVKGSHSDGIRSACQTGKRLAVIPASDLDHEAFLLKLPITSLWVEKDLGADRGWFCWDNYMKYLKRMNVPHTALVATSMRFVPTSEYPQVVFKYTGQLDEEGMSKMADRVDSEEVKHILGLDRRYADRIGKREESTPVQNVAQPATNVAKQATHADDFDDAPAVQAVPAKVEKPKTVKPKPAPQPVDEFDEPAPVQVAPEPVKAAAKPVEQPVVVADISDLSAALADWD